MIYIGMDNGSTGTVGIVNTDRTICDFFNTPIIKELSYNTTSKKFVSELDIEVFSNRVKGLIGDSKEPIFAILERPFSNGQAMYRNSVKLAYGFFVLQKQSMKLMGIGYEVMDSKKWQKKILPPGTTSSGDLKRASKDIGIRLYPQFKTIMTRQGDADGMLIAEYARIMKL